jgi:hypothetical protein
MSSSEEEVSSSGEEVSSFEEEDYVTEEDLVQREKRAKNIFRDFQIRHVKFDCTNDFGMNSERFLMGGQSKSSNNQVTQNVA